MCLATIPHHTHTSCSDNNAQAIPSLFVAAARDGAHRHQHPDYTKVQLRWSLYSGALLW